jgi:hypothetical protein
LIIVFPDPYRDELLYSVCARYKDLMPYRNGTTATRDFFGGDSPSAIVDLPNRIDHLLDSLVPGHLYTAEDFIYKNTHYPLYAPFLAPQRALAVYQSMRELGENHIHRRIGLTADRLPRPTRLRFCPGCVAEDLNIWGEIYWHRIHQVYGVDVCPDHEIFLEDSDALWTRHGHSQEAVSAESVVRGAPARALDPNDSTQYLLLSIARFVSWLLSWRGVPPGIATLRHRYHNLLLRQGLAYYNGRVRTKELVERFVAFFSPQFLVKLRCGITKVYNNWLLRLLRTSKGEAAQHPIRHILLIIFLGQTAEQFFEGFQEFRPFGEGPWPCLNPAAGHRGQPLITTHRIQEGTKGKPGVPRGIFKCDCGFTYARYGPDKQPGDRSRYDSVVEYGKVWEDFFTEQWRNPDITLSELAKKLRVIQFTLTRHAIRLGLPLDRQNRYFRPTSEKVINEYSKARETLSAAMERRKNKWLKLRKTHPNAGRQDLRKHAPYLYDWLHEHAPKWLEDNSPLNRTPLPPPVRVNWEDEDKLLATAVLSAAARIRNTPGKPVRVSLETVIREVGHRHWIESYRDKLPLTAAALKKSLETSEDFLIRRVKWTANCYKNEGVVPSWSMLSVRAGVKDRVRGKSVRVQEALDKALSDLALR